MLTPLPGLLKRLKRGEWGAAKRPSPQPQRSLPLHVQLYGWEGMGWTALSVLEIQFEKSCFAVFPWEGHKHGISG